MENNLKTLKENIEKYNINKSEIMIMSKALGKLNGNAVLTENKEAVEKYIHDFTKSINESFSGREEDIMFSVAEYIDMEYCEKLNQQNILSSSISDTAIDYLVKNQKNSAEINKLLNFFEKDEEFVAINIIKPIIENNRLNQSSLNVLLETIKEHDKPVDLRILSSLNLMSENKEDSNTLISFIRYYIDKTEELNKEDMLNINTIEYIVLKENNSDEQLNKIYGSSLELLKNNAEKYIKIENSTSGEVIALIEKDLKSNSLEINKNEIAVKNIVGFYMSGKVNNDILKEIINYSEMKKFDTSIIVRTMLLDSNVESAKVILDEFEKVLPLYEKSGMLKFVKNFKYNDAEIEFLSENKWFQKEIAERLVNEFKNKNNGSIEYAINLMYVNENIMNSTRMKDENLKSIVSLDLISEILDQNKEKNANIIFESESLSHKVINELLPYAYWVKDRSPDVSDGILKILKRDEVFNIIDKVRFNNEEDKLKEKSKKEAFVLKNKKPKI